MAMIVIKDILIIVKFATTEYLKQLAEVHEDRQNEPEDIYCMSYL